MKETSKMPSKLLVQFYMSYAGWLDMGAPHEVVYRRSHGLCDNLYVWCQLHKHDYEPLLKEMQRNFIDAGLNKWTPFNDQETNPYGDHSASQTHHANPLRINWVRTHSTLGVTLYPELVEEAKQK